MEVGVKKMEKNENKLNAKLFVRILPSTDFSYNSIKLDNNEKVLYIRCLQDSSRRIKPKNQNYWYFCTDGVFWNSTQANVYETVTSDLYEELFKGSQALIFCYGQTGSGKTFTTSGLRFQYQNRGLILRILSRLFEEENLRRDVTKIRFGISYVEFMGETVRDLIMNKKIKSFRDLREYPMTNEAWAWKQIFEAECRKSYSGKAPYEGSNRAHSVLTFYMHAESLIDTDPVITHSKIHIVDMSGIGSLGNKCSYWKNKSDLGNSNLSKCFMEQFLLCQSSSNSHDIHSCPAKSSRFLLYLHDTMQPHCIVRFIAHILGNDQNIRLTLSTLKFGEKVRNFNVTKLERVSEYGPLQLKNLEKECIRLRKEMELTGMILNSPDFGDISQQRMQEIQRSVEGFLFGHLEGLTLLSLGQATLTLKVFRDLYQKLTAEKDLAVKEAISQTKEMIQAQSPWDRNLSLNFKGSSFNSQKILRNKSRQQDSQPAVATIRSQESSQSKSLSSNWNTPQQVGTTDKKGISIGPGKTSSNFEGNIAKAFHKLRSRKSDGTIAKRIASSTTTKESGVMTKNQSSDDIIDLPSEIPLRDAALQRFFDEKTDFVNELRSEIKSCEEGGSAAQKKYIATINELAKLKEEMEECKLELKNFEHIREICGREKFDEKGNLIPEEVEKNLMNSLAQMEHQINIAVENCHVALADFTNSIEKLNYVKKSLEVAFQDFCKEEYKVPLTLDDFTSDELYLKTSSKETVVDMDLNSRAQMVLYLHLQGKLFNFVPKAPKREWKKMF